jgi:GTP cyclohydrolase I
MQESKTVQLAKLTEEQLRLLGEDPARDGLIRTPFRVAQALMDLTVGYLQKPEEVINGALFDVQCDEMVIVKDIDFYSLCEHHMLPFFGKCHIGYLPSQKVIGLSKLPRLVDVFARRLQVQERLTVQIAEAIAKVTEARGVGVIVEAEHLCMQMRGVEKQHSRTHTSAMFGEFRSDARTRSEFLGLIRAR